MATKLFLRNTTDNGVGSGYKDMLPTAGSGIQTLTSNATTASGTEIGFPSGSEAVWISGYTPPAGFTLTTTDISMWQVESNMSANIGGRYRLYKRDINGTETELGGGPFNDGVEMNTTVREDTWVGNPTDTAFAVNDRLVVKYFVTNAGTMGAGYTATISYNAADAATGDSFFNIAETVAFGTHPFPSAPTLNSPADASSSTDSTPTFDFTGTAPDAHDLEYEIQIDTVDTFPAPDLDKLSSVPDAGFVNPDTGGDTHPFNSGENIQYTVQGGDALAIGSYFWRVRCRDSLGGATDWSLWSSVRSFTVEQVYFPVTFGVKVTT